jgi:hypothetical protein
MNILALTDLRGEIQYAERLAEVCQGAAVEAVVFSGNVVSAGARVAEWAAAHSEVVAPTVALVHRSFARLGRNFVVAGFGDRLTEDKRKSTWVIEYPFWEAEFSFDFLNRRDQDRILLFSTPPGVLRRCALGSRYGNGHTAVSGSGRRAQIRCPAPIDRDRHLG